jgi:ribose transport system ATP-binding protein
MMAGIFLLAQVFIATNNLGASFPLLAFTACFLGGAALSGGRGVFLGVILGAVFLGMLTNIAPLLGWPAATSVIVSGVLTLVAVIAYAERRGGGGSRRGRTPHSQSATLASSEPELVER